MNYRDANLSEYKEIAILHANSWKKYYRNILSDDYLDNEVEQDRLTVWHERSKISDKNRRVLVAVKNDSIIGFACTVLHSSPDFGAILDNLHVSAENQGRGIGIALLQQSFDWVKENTPEEKMFLYVLKDNQKSKAFYYRFGGKFEEEFLKFEPDGGQFMIERISWNERPQLIL